MINRELARTFHHGESSSGASRSGSVPVNLRSRYADDFGSNVERGVDYRIPMQKPKAQKHVREDDKLLFKDSVSHEVYSSHKGVCPRSPIRPLVNEKQTNAGSGCRFRGSTRYSEEFLDLSRDDGNKVELVKGRDDSNRINGNSIPNRLRSYLYENEVRDVSALPVSIESILADGTESLDKRPSRKYSDNPYLGDYLLHSC